MTIRKLFSKTSPKTPVNPSGFTLIEMAISLIIIGFVLAAGIQLYALYKENQERTLTTQAVSRATTAIFEYKNAHGRFPCPAPIKEARTSPNYGHETDCADPTIGTGVVVPPGKCLNGTTAPDNYDGICVEQSTRVPALPNPRIRVGSIPFRELQIDEKDTIDGYGSRLVYAVTENMAASAALFKDSEAGIELRDGNGNVMSNNNQSIAFMVISPGKNKNGAVSLNGTVSACNNAANMLDAENCRDFASLLNTQAIYAYNAQSAGTSEFDDTVEYFVPTEAELWRRENPTSENIIDLSENNVGVGVTTPSNLTDTLTIEQSTVNNTANINDSRNLNVTNSLGNKNQSGALRVGKYSAGAHSGKVLADQYCTDDGTNCFTTDRIVGAYDNDPSAGTSGMGCPAGQYMTGIGSGRAICAPIRMACSSGKVLKGFNADGSPICEVPLQSCPDETQALCGHSYVLSAAGNGSVRTINYNTGGACAYANYTCVNGVWTLGTHFDTAYACTFTTAGQPTQSLSGQACTTGYTGTYTQNQAQNCLGNWVNTTNTAAADCNCVGVTSNVNCVAAFGGAIAGTKSKVCLDAHTLDTNYTVFTGNDTLSYGTEAALLAANCVCGKTEDWEFTTKTNYVLTASPTPASFASPVKSWPGGAGSANCQYRKRNVDTSTCSYTYTGWDSSNCECATGYNWKHTNPTCAACNEVDTQNNIRQIRGGGTCGWIDDPDTSANVAGTCKPINYIWKSSGVVAGPSKPLADGRGTSPVCTSACTCGENGSTGTCAIATATEWTFYSATCQPQ
ncbi:MAG TPA: type II secretion system protein [Alphaproteobacteria bacterium]|nr:type II secretion system protein [Alphaproteobacteria bacterium]